MQLSTLLYSLIYKWYLWVVATFFNLHTVQPQVNWTDVICSYWNFKPECSRFKFALHMYFPMKFKSILLFVQKNKICTLREQINVLLIIDAAFSLHFNRIYKYTLSYIILNWDCPTQLRLCMGTLSKPTKRPENKSRKCLFLVTYTCLRIPIIRLAQAWIFTASSYLKQN